MSYLDSIIYRLARKGELPFFRPQGKTHGTTSILAYDKSWKILACRGTVTPTGAGYAVGGFYMNTTTGAWYQNTGTTTVANFVAVGTVTAASVVTASIAANAVTPVKLGTRTLVALADAAATPTIAQLMTSSIFTMTPTAARNFTIPAAATIVAGITGATVGTWFDFTIVNLAAFAITLVAGTNGTLVGNVTVNKGSTTFRAVLTNVGAGTEALSVYNIGADVDVTSSQIDPTVIQVDRIAISAADIVTASTIKTLVAAPATGYYINFLGLALSFTYGGAAYTGGGNLSCTINSVAVSNATTAASDTFASGSSIIKKFNPLNAAPPATILKETALLLSTTGTFVNGGSATGTAVAYVSYQILPIA